MTVYATHNKPFPAGGNASATNDDDQIVGTVFDSNGTTAGFFGSLGSIVAIAYPGAVSTVPTGINNSGQIVGTYYDSNNVGHGFLWSNNTFTSLDVPSARYTAPAAISASGTIVGSYEDTSYAIFGFIYQAGIFTTTPYSVSGINASGEIVGRSDVQTGYFQTGGTTAYFQLPQQFQVVSLSITGVDDRGDISGSYYNGAHLGGQNGTYGFVRNADGTFSTSGLEHQNVTGINNNGELIGYDHLEGKPFVENVAAVSHDFNHDRTSDVLLQNGSSVVTWSISSDVYQSGKPVGNATGYQVVGTGDFNGDGTTDALFQNGQNIVDWILKDGGYAAGNIVGDRAGYAVVGTGDLNGDGTTDIILQNGSSLVGWVMQDGKYVAGSSYNTSGYAVVGTGDFNADGVTDILLQNGTSLVDWIGPAKGYLNYPYSSGPSSHAVGDTAGYAVVGTGDFNGDGTADILLQSGSSVVEWIMQNGVYKSSSVVANSSGYQVVSTGDYNGDGTSDILLQSGSSVVQWTMQNGAYQSGAVLANASGFAVKA